MTPDEAKRHHAKLDSFLRRQENKGLDHGELLELAEAELPPETYEFMVKAVECRVMMEMFRHKVRRNPGLREKLYRFADELDRQKNNKPGTSRFVFDLFIDGPKLGKPLH